MPAVVANRRERDSCIKQRALVEGIDAEQPAELMPTNPSLHVRRVCRRVAPSDSQRCLQRNSYHPNAPIGPAACPLALSDRRGPPHRVDPPQATVRQSTAAGAAEQPTDQRRAASALHVCAVLRIGALGERRTWKAARSATG
jgi:hypothetical protein